MENLLKLELEAVIAMSVAEEDFLNASVEANITCMQKEQLQEFKIAGEIKPEEKQQQIAYVIDQMNKAKRKAAVSVITNSKGSL